MTRIYIDHELTEGDEFTLPGASAHHVSTVLRLSADAEVTLFNGRGGHRCLVDFSCFFPLRCPASQDTGRQ